MDVVRRIRRGDMDMAVFLVVRSISEDLAIGPLKAGVNDCFNCFNREKKT